MTNVGGGAASAPSSDKMIDQLQPGAVVFFRAFAPPVIKNCKKTNVVALALQNVEDVGFPSIGFIGVFKMAMSCMPSRLRSMFETAVPCHCTNSTPKDKDGNDGEDNNNNNDGAFRCVFKNRVCFESWWENTPACENL